MFCLYNNSLASKFFKKPKNHIDFVIGETLQFYRIALLQFQAQELYISLSG
jgi:hypothetical protein